MSKNYKILMLCGLMIVVLLSILNLIQSATASNEIAIQLDPSPTSNSQSISQTITPAFDPDLIGDTSGVIFFGMIIIFIIVAGVIWGGLVYKK